MTFKQYEKMNRQTDRGDDSNLWYPCLGLAGEVGEVTEPIKKFYRDGKAIDRQSMLLECGDVLWYLTTLLRRQGFTLEEAAAANATKLIERYGKKDKRKGTY